ncbi:hypothetical protein WH50_20960 [Pokkaliibacter plantistimulans]|uniref:Carboxyltransferase domain-containing protein n=1 Tax=Pokkaliibacter plantistimulans TaxID=1635171 RepID=A0ABX5LRU7_9GAMM|nr:5-oxoprolinase subunit PxpB [Pokkaliibacter plantistimulans]PXF29364.1 hypothetical protein WH50_20960 [Pokkaliibacter plantistimulans]
MLWRAQIVGVDALMLYFGDRIDEKLSPLILEAKHRLQSGLAERLVEVVPSYTSLYLQYDLLRDDYASFLAAVEHCLRSLDVDSADKVAGAIKYIPVYYSQESGPDLGNLAQRHGLAVEEVIALHTSKIYVTFAIGFTPGFAFLGQVDARIATPRISTPRTKVPMGSVGIADTQTGIYPSVTPGGWNLIGRTPLLMFDAARSAPAFLQVGDRVQFKAIDRETYLQQGGML